VRPVAVDGGTRVDLEHRDLPPAEHRGHAIGWAHYLRRVESAAAGRDPGRDPGMPDEARPANARSERPAP
jgi:hypothetical protein